MPIPSEMASIGTSLSGISDVHLTRVHLVELQHLEHEFSPYHVFHTFPNNFELGHNLSLGSNRSKDPILNRQPFRIRRRFLAEKPTDT